VDTILTSPSRQLKRGLPDAYVVYTMADDDRIDDGVVPVIERRKHRREFKEMVVCAAMQPHVSIAWRCITA